MSHGHGEDLSQHEQELLAEAHFTGPPEEDPVLDLLLCPFKTYPKDPEQITETPEDHAYLEEIIEHNEHDPSIVWFGLFTDLIFVAVIVQFANQFKNFYKYESLNYEGADQEAFYIRIFAETFLFFFGFYTVWLELCQVNTRFHNLAGGLDDALFFTYLCGVIVMAVQMDPNRFLTYNKVGFIAGLLICFIALFGLHVAYTVYIERAVRYAERRLYTYSFAIIVLVIALIVALARDIEDEFAIWWCVFSILIACGTVLSVAFISFRVDPRYFPWTLEYFSERFGILVMILTGESILALMVGDTSASFAYYYTTEYYNTTVSVLTTAVDEYGDAIYETTIEQVEYQLLNYEYNHLYYQVYADTGAFFQYGVESNIDDYLGVLIAFATMYVMKNIYFESKAEADEHALQEYGHPGSVVWVFTHLPLTFCLLGCGVGYKLCFTAVHGDAPTGYRLVLGCSACMAIICMLIIRAAHDKFVFPIESMAIRIPTAVVIPMGVLFLENTLHYFAWVFAFVTLSWIYDLTIMPFLEVKDEKHDDHGTHGGHDEKHGDEIHVHTEKAGVPGFCGYFMHICGLEDGEFADAFHGPKHEADPRELCLDVFCCKLNDEPADVPLYFPKSFIKEISTDHGHGHGHGGHDEHGHGEGDEEASSDHGWFGEFTDLIFVAVIIKFADQMKYKQTAVNLRDADLVETDQEKTRIYLEAAVYFGAFFVCWLELTHCLIRFKNMPGIFDDVMYFLYLCGVIGMAIQMNHFEYCFERREAFCCWFAFSMFCLVVLHAKFHTIDAAENYCKKRIVAFFATMCMALVAAFLKMYPCAILLCLSYAVSLWISLNSFRVWKQSKANPHVQHEYVERFGLLVMITSGESILALVIAEFKQTYHFYCIVLFAFAIMFVIRSIYFASHSEQPSCHALSEGQMPGSVLWAAAHGPLAYCLLCCGVGFKMILSYADADSIDYMARYTLGFSLAATIGCMYIIRAAHNKFTLPFASLLIRGPVVSLCPLGAIFIENPLAYVAWNLLIVSVCYILDILLIDVLEFEIDKDFMTTLTAHKKKKADKISHSRSLSKSKELRGLLEKDSVEMHDRSRKTGAHHNHGHDNHHHGSHHHDNHHSSHHHDNHHGSHHHDNHHGNHRSDHHYGGNDHHYRQGGHGSH